MQEVLTEFFDRIGQHKYGIKKEKKKLFLQDTVKKILLYHADRTLKPKSELEVEEISLHDWMKICAAGNKRRSIKITAVCNTLIDKKKKKWAGQIN